jgi:hypothetical protein
VYIYTVHGRVAHYGRMMVTPMQMIMIYSFPVVELRLPVGDVKIRKYEDNDVII